MASVTYIGSFPQLVPSSQAGLGTGCSDVTSVHLHWLVDQGSEVRSPLGTSWCTDVLQPEVSTPVAHEDKLLRPKRVCGTRKPRVSGFIFLERDKHSTPYKQTRFEVLRGKKSHSKVVLTSTELRHSVPPLNWDSKFLPHLGFLPLEVFLV